jgi:hypothetical protein
MVILSSKGCETGDFFAGALGMISAAKTGNESESAIIRTNRRVMLTPFAAQFVYND